MKVVNIGTPAASAATQYWAGSATRLETQHRVYCYWASARTKHARSSAVKGDNLCKSCTICDIVLGFCALLLCGCADDFEDRRQRTIDAVADHQIINRLDRYANPLIVQTLNSVTHSESMAPKLAAAVAIHAGGDDWEILFYWIEDVMREHVWLVIDRRGHEVARFVFDPTTLQINRENVGSLILYHGISTVSLGMSPEEMKAGDYYLSAADYNERQPIKVFHRE